MNKKVRVRFAPAPTGLMHIGNVRTALFNYLFAKQKGGTFVLRIEDTDPTRNYDPSGTIIISDLKWLGLEFDEGPDVGGPYTPYFQSKRDDIYKEKLQELADKGDIYRCFCTQDHLEKQRERQRALHLPPRYDRTCLRLTQAEIDALLAEKKPFIWRFKLDHEKVIEITDLARGTVRFELKNFSDFPLTRQDGSFTFMFANFVDDMLMNITYVFRGEDHLSNTASQAAMYEAFNAPLPTFWHMPILCNVNGKKLSKRDFGFSLHDLRDEGFLPEAINNYLAIIGTSFAQEIMSLKELVQAFDFSQLSTAGQIKYDVDKLRWINRHWIVQYDPKKLAALCRPFLEKAYPAVKELSDAQLATLLDIIKSDLTTLADSVQALGFYFELPVITASDIQACMPPEHRHAIFELVSGVVDQLVSKDFVSLVKKEAAVKKIPIKHLFWFLRLALMGSTKGPGINELITMLGVKESHERIEQALKLLRGIQ